MKQISWWLLGASLLLAGCGQSSPPAATSTANPYADGIDHSWTASTAEGQRIYSALSQGLKSQDFNLGLSITATNGWGPIELNTSNGEFRAGDGKPITLNGKAYATGLGVHADSEIHIQATGLVTPACTRFQADVGIDDEVGDQGSVVFQVFADGTKVFDSGVMTGASATQHIDVGIGNKSDLRFVVTNGGDGYSYDHADWAGANLTCENPPPSTPAGSIDTAYAPAQTQGVEETAMQADGKLLEFGRSPVPGEGTRQQFFLQRLDQSGKIDTSFGANGRVTFNFSIAGTARRLIVQPDGKILALGRGSLPAEPAEGVDTRGFAFIVRFLPDGSLDTTFGNSELSGFEGFLFAEDESLLGLALSPDGQIITGGTSAATDTIPAYIIRRYTPAGRLDSTFGMAGRADINLPDATSASLKAVAVQADGRVIALGGRQTGDTASWTVARLQANGTVDAGFGSGGVGTYNAKLGSGSAQDARLLADGQLLLAGDAGSTEEDLCSVLRLLPTGTPDPSFTPTTSGQLVAGDLTVHRITLVTQTDGKAIIGGCQRPGVGSAEPALARYNTDGSQDLKFGTMDNAGTTAAVVVDSFSPQVQPKTDGKIIVGLTRINRVNP